MVASRLLARVDVSAAFDWRELYQQFLKNDPFPKQMQAHESPADELFFGGAAGPGKSTVGLILAIGLCLLIPNFSAAIFRRTFPELNRYHIKLSRRWLALWEAKGICRYRANEKTWEFNNGSTLEFCHCQHETDVNLYQTAEFDLVVIDEASEWTFEMYTAILARLRTSRPGIKPRMVIVSNPGGIGHAWLKERFIEPDQEVRGFDAQGAPLPPPEWNGEVWVPQKLTDEEREVGVRPLSRAFIQSLIWDNPVLLENDPGYISRVSQRPEPYRSMLLQGLWDVHVGAAFPEFRRRYHVIDAAQVKLEPYWYCFRALDWGYSRPYSVGWYAVDDDNRLIKYRELYGYGGGSNQGSRETVDEVAEKIKAYDEADRREGRIVRPGPADPSINSPGQDGGSSIFEKFARAGVPWILADRSKNSRTQGKQTLHGLFRLQGEAENRRPNLLFSSVCHHTIRTFSALQIDSANWEDVDTDQEEHAYDETRYAAQSRAHRAKKPEGISSVIQKHKEQLAKKFRRRDVA